VFSMLTAGATISNQRSETRGRRPMPSLVLLSLSVILVLLIFSIMIRSSIIPYLLIILPSVMSGPLQVILFGSLTGTGTISAFVILFGVAYLGFIKRNGLTGLKRGRLLLPLVIYVMVFGFNLMFVGEGFGLNDGTRRWITEIALSISLYALAIYAIKKDGVARLRKWLAVLLILESVISVVTILFFEGLSFFSSVAAQHGDVTRDYTQFALQGNDPLVSLSGGTFVQSNVLGAFIVLLFPQLLPFVSRDYSGPLKRFFQINLVMVLAALVLTLSRGAWLAFGVSAIILALFGTKQNRRSFLLLSTLVALIYVIPSVYSAVAARISFGFTVEQREELAAIGLSLFHSRPWFGYGLSTFFGEDSRNFPIVNPHNDYLVRLIGGGLVGLGAFLLVLFVALLVPAVRLSRAVHSYERREAVIVLSSIVGFCIVSATNPVQLHFPLIPVVFAIFEASLPMASPITKEPAFIQ